jgi:hypothetical protein
VVVARQVPGSLAVRFAIVALAAAATFTPARVIAQQASSADAPAAKLTGAAAWQQLVGNTVVAEARSGGYTEFYGTDGAVIHLDKDGKAKGRWTLEGDKVCFDFPEEDDRSCVNVSLDGRKGAFVDEDASQDTFTLLPGNAKAL